MIKAVLVGCGGISHAWLTAAAKIPGLEIAGLVDVRAEAARARAAEFKLPGAVLGTELAEVLDRVKPDAVFDCTVPPAHADVCVSALGKGCHVLGEKPMADSLDAAHRILSAARAAGKLHAVTQTRRYDRNLRRMKRFLDSGAQGRIGTVHCDFMIGAHFGGFRDRMRHVLVEDMAIHTFDAARFLIGTDPASVFCREWNPPGSWYDHDASAAAIFEMTGGCVYTYRGSWCAEGLNTSWECDWRFIGERGSATWDGHGGIRAQVVESSGGFHSVWKDLSILPLEPSDKDGGHLGVITEFVECVRTGAVPETAGEDNIKSLAMVLGAVESSEGGRLVPVRW
ncbi:MAG: Gfo/Idh/MocA family oxidoreductase [bacterium]